MISNVINNDSDVKDFYKVVYLPDYKVSLAQLIIPAADLSQHISPAGTEASGTSNMKFAMTGSLLIGTRDGANIEISQEIGEENIFFFGNDVNAVTKIRNEMKSSKLTSVDKLPLKIIDTVLSGKFGDCGFIKDYLNKMKNGCDIYLVCHEFNSYCIAQEQVDKEYTDINKWYTKALISISKMGYFSSDRSVQDYSDKIWKLTPVEVPKPSVEKSKRVISFTNLCKVVTMKRSKTFTCN